MRFTGRLKEPIIDFATHRLTILFEPQQDFSQAYEELKDCEKLSLEIKRYRRKRSLDANAYYWVLLTKLANAMQTSNPEMHNRMLIHYGQPEIIEGKAIYMTIPDTEEAERKVLNATDYHLQPTSQVREGVDGVMYRTYKLLRGSHTYDTGLTTLKRFLKASTQRSFESKRGIITTLNGGDMTWMIWKASYLEGD